MSLERGVDLYNRGAYWEAHEAWEEEWAQDRHGPEAAFLKGLIQVAAGNLHYTRRNRRGTVNKWAGGMLLLAAYRPAHRGLDVEAAWTSTAANLAFLERSAGWPELELPALRESRGPAQP